MTEAAQRLRCWTLAKRLFTRWHSRHAASNYETGWKALGYWGQGYWYSVTEFVYENFDEKSTP